jgi:hypothetical protein
MKWKLSGAHSPMAGMRIPFSLAFTIAARIRGPLAPEKLGGALERLRRRHPLIAVRIAPDEGGACFTTEGVPPVPLRVAERQSDDNWLQVVEHEIAQPFDYYAGPFFRCICLRGADVSDLILVFDHITTDGRSSMYALRDLLRLLVDDSLELEPLPPPRMAERIPAPMAVKIRETVSALRAEAPEGRGRPPAADLSEPMRILPIAFDEAETTALVARSRSEGTTVQAALCAAFALPFAELHPDAPVRFVETPMDIRARLVPPVGEEFGNYISLALVRVDCTPGRAPWEIARAARRALEAVTDEQLFTVPIVMMNVADRPLPVPPISVVYDLSISNVGRLDIPERYGPLRLESIYGPTLNISHAGHRILAVTTFAGRMRCTFASRDPEGEWVVRRAREWIAAMLRAGGES